MTAKDEMIKMAWDIAWPKTRQMDAKFIRKKVNEIKHYRSIFLAIPDEKFKSCDQFDLLEILSEAYSNLALLPDEQIFQKFRKAGVNKRFLKWFVHLTDILSEFKKIEKSREIKVNTYIALGAIFMHLDIKIQHELWQWMGLVYVDSDRRENSIYYQKICNIYRQRRVILKNAKKFKDSNDAKIHKMIDEYEKTFGKDTKPEQWLKDTSRGLTSRNVLKYLVECGFICVAPITKRKLYIAIYDLIKLITKDEFLMYSEKEFNSIMLDKDATYDYDQYRARRIKQIIEKK